MVNDVVEEFYRKCLMVHYVVVDADVGSRKKRMVGSLSFIGLLWAKYVNILETSLFVGIFRKE